MAVASPPFLHKEARLNLEAPVPGSTVFVRLPSTGALASLRSPQKRSHVADLPPTEDEGDFRQRHLAIAGSIYFRKHHSFPRSFLWRILEDGKVLTIRVVDLCKEVDSPDSHLTLRFTFPSPIRPTCVAFADAKGSSTLSAFVLTESNQLYTFALRPEFFRSTSSTEDHLTESFQTYTSSSFGFKHPFRLVALSSDELMISLHDGGLLKLDRKSAENGSVWKETFYNAGGWGLKAFIPYRGNNTVRYMKMNLELSAVTSIAIQQTSLGGIPYLFTVSLDHKIRVWDLVNGKIAKEMDMLNEKRDPNEMAKFIIQPSESQLIRICGFNNFHIWFATYSPIRGGQFKFWKATEGQDNTLDLVDLCPENKLLPPAPTKDVWTVNGFSATLSKERDRITLWVLFKNNVSYRLQKAELDIDSEAELKVSWDDNWSAVSPETLGSRPLPSVTSSDPADCTDKWLEYILYPGKFTTATIETALSIYQRGIGLPKDSISRKSKNLVEKMTSLIAYSTRLDADGSGELAYEHYRKATDLEWRRLYRLLLELDKQRGEALSLGFDPEQEMPWVATADGVSAIRQCSLVERLWHNEDTVPPEMDQFSGDLVSAAMQFRESFSDSLSYACNAVMKTELLQEPSSSPRERMDSFYTRCNFENQIGNEEWEQLRANIGGEAGTFEKVTSSVYDSLLSALGSSEIKEPRSDKLPMADFGRKLVLRGVQETVELHRRICFDQLVLLVFMEAEVGPDYEHTLDTPSWIFNRLVVILKRLELVSWLAKTRLSIPAKKINGTTPSKYSSHNHSKKAQDGALTMTVLEGCLGTLVGLDSQSGDMPSSVTALLTSICHPESEYMLETAPIQCFLISMRRPDLALEFGQFCAQDPFSFYVQGRACLAARDLPTAAMYFQRAAFDLGHPEPKMSAERHSSGLLDETDWKLFYAGLPEYYSHIVGLFDKEKLYSYVIDFARLSLQFSGIHGRPNKSAESIQLRTEMHSRLFNAAIQTSRFDIAHSTLAMFTDLALQQSSLRTLVLKICETGCTSQLLSLPFLSLQSAVDDILAQKASSIADPNVGIPYHKILYAWRIRHQDFRGAASVALERLQRLQQLGDGDLGARADGEAVLETPVTNAFVSVINALSCVDPNHAWVLSEGLPSAGSRGNGTLQKRKVVTLEDVRRAYQAELDRIAAIENNQFAFGEGMDMEL